MGRWHDLSQKLTPQQREQYDALIEFARDLRGNTLRYGKRYGWWLLQWGTFLVAGSLFVAILPFWIVALVHFDFSYTAECTLYGLVFLSLTRWAYRQTWRRKI